MESSEPATIIAAVAAAVSIGTGVYSATQKPDSPDAPKGPTQSPTALAQQRQQRAAAARRSQTILTGGSKLGQVGS